MKQINYAFCRAILPLVMFTTSLSAAQPKRRCDSVRYLDAFVSNLRLTSKSDNGKVVYAHPGEVISGQADCKSHRPTHLFEKTQFIVGFDQIGAQDTLTHGTFTLTAPNQPGIYEVRFRYAQAESEQDAIDFWWNVDGAPSEQATIGLVIVTENPNEPRTIDESNWKEWLADKYAGKDHVSNSVQTLPTLTAEQVSAPDFWDASQTTGVWTIDGSVLSNQGTMRYNAYNQLVSRDAFQDFNLRVTTEYEYTRNAEANWWSHARGFGIVYYVNEDRNVEFRYFADVGQLSLYIRDKDKVIEKITKISYAQGTEIIQDISIENGVIRWDVNGKRIFNETTALEEGHLKLTNHNNAVTFRFDG